MMVVMNIYTSVYAGAFGKGNPLLASVSRPVMAQWLIGVGN